jgi:hypothetical protein
LWGIHELYNRGHTKIYNTITLLSKPFVVVVKVHTETLKNIQTI